MGFALRLSPRGLHVNRRRVGRARLTHRTKVHENLGGYDVSFILEQDPTCEPDALTIEIDEPGAAYFRRYMGGWNIIADTLLREAPAKANPLAVCRGKHVAAIS